MAVVVTCLAVGVAAFGVGAAAVGLDQARVTERDQNKRQKAAIELHKIDT